MTPTDLASLATSLRNVALRLERGDADSAMADAEIDAYGESVRLAAVLLRELAREIEGGSHKVKRRPMPAGASEVDRPLFSESPDKVKRRPVDGRRFGGARDEEASQALAEDYRDPARQGQDRPLIGEDGQPGSGRVGLPRSRR